MDQEPVKKKPRTKYSFQPILGKSKSPIDKEVVEIPSSSSQPAHVNSPAIKPTRRMSMGSEDKVYWQSTPSKKRINVASSPFDPSKVVTNTEVLPKKFAVSFDNFSSPKCADITDVEEDDFDDDMDEELLAATQSKPRDFTEQSIDSEGDTMDEMILKTQPFGTDVKADSISRETSVKLGDSILAGTSIKLGDSILSGDSLNVGVHLGDTVQQTIKNTDSISADVFRREIEGNAPVTVMVKDDNKAKCAVLRKGMARYQIREVIESSYTVEGRNKIQKVLVVRDGEDVISRLVVRGCWSDLDFEPNDVIHIIGEPTKLVDDNTMLIWNPDLLLSATLVSDTINCERRSVLNTKLAMPGESNLALLVGTLVHRIFQECLKQQTCDIVDNLIEELLEENNMEIIILNETKESLKLEIMQHLPFIREWIDIYCKHGGRVRVNGSLDKEPFAVTNILDIEENIWSPMFGLRGLIDATVESHTQSGKFITPWELKTGKNMSVSHSAQGSLYTLLMKDRYDLDVKFFLLVYSKLKDTVKFPIVPHDVRSLLMLRNRVSQFLKDGSRALPPLQRNSKCDRCFALDSCMVYNKLMEGGCAEEAGLQEGVYDDLTDHLENKEYATFFNYYDDLLTKEEKSINGVKKELFLIDSKTRESTSGKCLGGLCMTDSDESDDGRFLYRFERSTKEGVDMNTLQLSKNDRVIVSDESGHFALCSGTIHVVRKSFIVIITERRLKNHNVHKRGFDVTKNQVFQSVLKPLEEQASSQVLYRIDKDEIFHGLALARYNLLNLFLPDGDHKTRELLVDKRAPRFTKKLIPFELPPGFNPDQSAAFEKVLSAQDYSLILGMPGTGKTTVIAQLIKALVAAGKTILLTSYTHSAVDNILLKLLDLGPNNIIRLGAVNRVHPEARIFSPGHVETREELETQFLKPKVVACTCLGIKDWLFNVRQFDYCILDEASQVAMPIALGPLRFADKFILVGDHYQLPPLIINPEASGLAVSLFKTLSDMHPESMVDLSYQYRMSEDIMMLSNTLIYDGRLKCGTEAVANQMLTLPKPWTRVPGWMDPVLEPGNRVLFLDHDEVPCYENSVKENIENHGEAELVRQIVESMCECGVDESSIGIMSLYRGQLRVFYRQFMSTRPNLEILTADQFQGRDKDVIIISMVKSNANFNAGSLLKEWRRVNVAITRAKSKLIIVGSKKTMSSIPMMEAFMNVIEARGWMHKLPKDADKFYQFDPPPASNTVSTQSGAKTITAASQFVSKKPVLKNILQGL